MYTTDVRRVHAWWTTRLAPADDNEPVTNPEAVSWPKAVSRFLTRQSGPPSKPGRRGQVFDVLLALALGILMLRFAEDIAEQREGPDRPGFIGPIGPPAEDGSGASLMVLAIVASAALALRRRYPLAVLWVVTAAAMVTPTDLQKLTFYASVIAVYTAVMYSPYRGATLVTLPLAVVLVTTAGDSATSFMPDEYVPLLVLIPIAVTANGLRNWRMRSDEGQARLAAVEREQAEALRRAVEHERARIARDLHDVVTHNVSVMVIQAGAARKIMATDPDQASTALLAVEAGGRAAMAELRHVMGLLTMNDPEDSADLEPQPGLGQLESLVGRVRDAGLPVELAVTGTARPLPPGVELAAYRVVQEALTNTVKHTSGASATVTIEYGDDQLRVEVLDTGGDPGELVAEGNGRGLIGLRERLAVYGGTLHTVRRPRGGYRVEAIIPLAAANPAAPTMAAPTLEAP